MNRQTILIALIAFTLGVAATGLALRAGRTPAMNPAQPDATAKTATRYYCAMHPSYISDKPGDCPICQMRLIPVEGEHGRDATSAPLTPSPLQAVAGRAPVRVSSEKQQLIGVKTSLVERKPLVRSIRAVGRVAFDETRLHHVHTKVGGWIERLDANATGELVRKGQPLLTIYSPELLASQQEYLLALKARQRLSGTTISSVAGSGDELVASSRRRLRLYDMTDDQIARLESAGEATRTMTLYAPMSGHIVTRNVSQGERIEPGTALLDIADLSHVWILADIYEYELPFVQVGQTAALSLSYLPGRRFEGKIAFVYPVLSDMTRTVKVRLELANPDLELKPGMFGQVELRSDLGERLVIPESAIISTGEREVVFVDRGEGYFEPRELTLGVRLADDIEVLAGLAEGDRVLTSGNFLIDSESKLKAALGAAAGTTSVPAHQH